MARTVLLIRDPATQQLVGSALRSATNSPVAIGVRHADSFAEAARLASKQHSALLLFDYPELNGGVLAEVASLRALAPACIVCAVSAKRQFYYDEVTSLRGAGVHAFLQKGTLADG